MKVVKLPLSDLKKPERNVRMHTEKQLKEFVRSIEMFGQIRPIVVDEDGTILAGNGLYEALKRMGQEKADVLKVTGMSGNQKKKLIYYRCSTAKNINYIRRLLNMSYLYQVS